MTANSVIPALIDALVAQAPAAFTAAGVTKVRVYDGYPVTNDRSDYLMVGVEDPTVDSAQASANSSQNWPHAGTRARDETGEITLAVRAWTGATSPKIVRDRAYKIADALGAYIRIPQNITLGVDGVLWTSFGTTSALSQGQDKNGAEALLIFKVAFMARLNT